MGCKNNQMYLFRTRNSHFNEDSFFLSQYSYSFCTGALYGADQFGKETASFPMSPINAKRTGNILRYYGG